MKVLMATQKGQGQRESDFCFTNDGEFVMFGFVCDNHTDIDDGCGCQRSLVGIDSLKATTTFEVIDFAVTLRGYTYLLYRSLKKLGYAGLVNPEDEALRIINLVKPFNVGDVLELRGCVSPFVDTTLKERYFLLT